MNNLIKIMSVAAAMMLGATTMTAQRYAKVPRFRALIYSNASVEVAHRQFAEQSREFFHRLTYGEGWILDHTENIDTFTVDRLKQYSVVICTDDMPHTSDARQAFQAYMEQGGGWLGFHAAGYNDRNTHWPWLNTLLGCGAFTCNSWPPQPVLMEVDTADHPVTRSLPREFVAPECEWYQFESPVTQNPDVDVLLSVSPRNYPLGFKDIILGGDLPVVWANRQFRMVYLNIGHGDREYSDATQNLLVANCLRWVVSRDPKGNPFDL